MTKVALLFQKNFQVFEQKSQKETKKFFKKEKKGDYRRKKVKGIKNSLKKAAKQP